jgi:hypothetical protein
MTGNCPYLRNSKQSIEGKAIITKRCIAFIPNFEVDAEKRICKICMVPKTLRKKGRCKFLAPLDIHQGETRFKCSLTLRKYVEPEKCQAKYVPILSSILKLIYMITRINLEFTLTQPPACRVRFTLSPQGRG